MFLVPPFGIFLAPSVLWLNWLETHFYARRIYAMMWSFRYKTLGLVDVLKKNLTTNNSPELLRYFRFSFPFWHKASEWKYTALPKYNNRRVTNWLKLCYNIDDFDDNIFNDDLDNHIDPWYLYLNMNQILRCFWVIVGAFVLSLITKANIDLKAPWCVLEIRVFVITPQQTFKKWSQMGGGQG